MEKVFVALITPFTEDDRIDLPALDRLIERLLSEGCDGFVVCGTTAETPTLKKEERMDILHHVIRKVNKQAEVWYGCGTNCTRNSITAVEEMEHEDIDGVLLVAPYYNRPNQQGLYEHFLAIANRTHHNIMLYNIPSRTGCDLSYETMDRLLRTCSNIKALKHASKDVTMVQKLHQKYPDFHIYSGEDDFFDEGMDAGMYGLVSVMGHVVLPQIKTFLEEGRVDNHSRKWLMEVASYTFMDASPAPIKHLLALRGECADILRLPMVALGKEACEKMEQWVAKSDILLQQK